LDFLDDAEEKMKDSQIKDFMYPKLLRRESQRRQNSEGAIGSADRVAQFRIVLEPPPHRSFFANIPDYGQHQPLRSGGFRRAESSRADRSLLFHGCARSARCCTQLIRLFFVWNAYPKAQPLPCIPLLDRENYADYSATQKWIIGYGIARRMGCLRAQQIWHRDLKAENIFLDENRYLCIADLGLAK
jgi:hypothetical protein